MSTARRFLRLGLVVAAATGLMLSAACGPAETSAEANDKTDAVSSLGEAYQPDEAQPQPQPEGTEPQPGGVQPGPTDILPNYPGNPEAYSKAVVAAWVQDHPATLASLTTNAVNDDILDLLPSVNDNWSFLRCDGTAGSSYCSFTNTDGDALTLRISHSLLSKPDAAIEVTLDKTEYPVDSVAYVKEFVAAWQFGNKARMLKLSSPTVANAVKAAPTNPSYPVPNCCGGGLVQVKVLWSAGGNARFDVGTMKLGGPNAIVGYAPGQLTITS